MTMTQDEIEVLLAYWQKALGLQDWRITVEICEYVRHEMDSYGECDYHENFRKARIRLADDECGLKIAGRAAPPPSLEFTLVHELIEIHLSGLDEAERRKGGAVNVRFEQAINAIADCLIHLRNAIKANRPSGKTGLKESSD